MYYRFLRRNGAGLLAVLGMLACSLPAPAVVEPDLWNVYGEGEGRLDSVDRRLETIDPDSVQIALAKELGATSVRWNRFGTPYTLFNHDGTLSGPNAGDPVQIARDWVLNYRDLFKLSIDQVDALELLRVSPLYDAPDLARVRDGLAPENPDVAHVVMFRQRAGGLHVAQGLLTTGVARDGSIVWVTSTVTGDDRLDGQQLLDPVGAIQAAAQDARMNVGTLTEIDLPGAWQSFSSSTIGDVQRVRPVAFPTTSAGLRRAWEVILLKATHDEQGHPKAFISFVDAESGAVWSRENRVDHLIGAGDTTLEDNGATKPNWRVFPTNPPTVIGANANLSVEERDTRKLWCWGSEDAGEGCDRDVSNLASRVPWDVNPIGFTPSLTTDGNNASAAISQVSFLTPDTVTDRPVAPLRGYEFGFNDVWNQNRCNPAVFAIDNDDAASTVNLWVGHNRMHDWSYFLGLTEGNGALQKSNFGNTSADRENDPELGQAQAGRLTVLGRDNANQITLPDGIPGITNQYLWQPLAGAFYGTCTDGAYDMAIVAHEYGHAISNRLTGGPDASLGSTQGQTEGWSDLIFAAYFLEYSFTAGEDVNPFALAPYVVGNSEAGIRNFAMNRSPLNYSNIDYDGMGLTSPHANGEVWAAVNFAILDALAEKYDADFPRNDQVRQRRCADGEFAAEACPGNRRWSQLMFDGMLLQPTGPNQLVSRDAMIAGDMMRFNGENQFILWETFARLGYGGNAESGPGNDRNPTPDWTNPLRDEHVTTRFELVDARTGEPVAGEVYVGIFQARVTPAADTHADSELSDIASFVPGDYQFFVRADGYGMARTSASLTKTGPDHKVQQVVRLELRPNVASVNRGASGMGDGFNHDGLIDDDEATMWEFDGEEVLGTQYTVALSERTRVDSVKASSMLTSANRFSSLRSFDLFACDAATADCNVDGSWVQIYESALPDFDAERPRPTVNEMTLRDFVVTESVATHVRMVVVSSQCTGNPRFTTEANQVDDPLFPATGCADPETDVGKTVLLNPPVGQVRAAELQVFGSPAALNLKPVDITDVVATAISNPDQSNGIFSLNLDLTNESDQNFDPAVEFIIVGINSASGTQEVINADNGGSGVSSKDPAVFDYSQFVTADNAFGQFDSGETIGPRRLAFRNEAAELFFFDAIVTAFKRVDGTTSGSSTNHPANGRGGSNGNGNGDSPGEITRLMRFAVDPLTGTVSVELLDVSGDVLL